MLNIQWYVYIASNGVYTRKSNEIAEINPTEKNSEQKSTTMSRKIWDSTMDNNAINNTEEQQE